MLQEFALTYVGCLARVQMMLLPDPERAQLIDVQQVFQPIAMILLEGSGLDEPTSQIVLQDVTILLMKTGGKDELMTNMFKALAGKFMELELEEESFNYGCQYLQVVAAIADAKLVYAFVDQFLDITLAKIAVLEREERADQYELLQKTLIDSIATIFVLKDENQALE